MHERLRAQLDMLKTVPKSVSSKIRKFSRISNPFFEQRQTQLEGGLSCFEWSRVQMAPLQRWLTEPENIAKTIQNSMARSKNVFRTSVDDCLVAQTTRNRKTLHIETLN